MFAFPDQRGDVPMTIARVEGSGVILVCLRQLGFKVASVSVSGSTALCLLFVVSGWLALEDRHFTYANMAWHAAAVYGVIMSIECSLLDG